MGIRDYLRILLRHRVYVISTFLVVFFGVAAWTFTQTSVYEAEGRLLFKRRDTAISSITGGLRGPDTSQLGAVAFGNPLETQAEIIRSRPLAEAVIRRLNLRDPGSGGELLDPEDFLKTIKIETLRRTDLITLRYRDSDARRAAAVVNEVGRLYMERNVIENRAEASSTRTFVESQLPVMEKQLRSAERQLRLFKEKYGTIALKEEEATAIRLLSEFRSQEASANVDLAEASSRVSSLARRVGMSEEDAIVATGLMKTDSISDLRKELLSAEAKLAVLRSQYQDSYPDVDQFIKRRDALRGLLQQEVAQLFRRQPIQLSLVDTTVDGGDPGQGPQLKDNLPRIDQVRQDLVKVLIDAKVSALADQTKLDALRSVSGQYALRVAELPGLEEKQAQLERAVDAGREAYQLLQRKYYETRVLEAQNIGNATLIDPAVAPIVPVWPRRTLLLSIGIVAALILGVGVAFVREYFNESIQTSDDVRDVLGSSILGMVPAFKPIEDDERIALSDPLSPVSESYRSIRTNLKFLGTDKPVKVVVLSSSGPREGKSTTAANLAIVSAQSGSRVLLIDADLRKPRQYRIWKTASHRGLSDALAGGGHWSEYLHQSELDSLSILPAGTHPPNPVALLESAKMAILLDEARALYDLVIIDAPPLTAATDATLLAALTDGLIFIVRPGIANKRLLAKLRDTLKNSRIKVLGQIVNGAIAENEGYAFYAYYNRYSDESTNGSNGKEKARTGNGRNGWFKSSPGGSGRTKK